MTNQDPHQTPEQWAQHPPQGPFAPKTRKSNTGVIAAVIVGAVLLLCAGCFGFVAVGGDPGPDTVAAEPAESQTTTEAAPDKPSTAKPEPTKPNLTATQKQAVGMAENYLEYTAFSRSGLIDQLKYEGFSKSDASFAVDYLDVDWMEQAAQMAKSYLDYTHFSRQGLIDQLKYEGFTTKQAEYGATKAGL